MFCRNCGKPIDDEVMFCPACGSPTTEGNDKKEKKMMKNKTQANQVKIMRQMRISQKMNLLQKCNQLKIIPIMILTTTK